MPESPKLDVLVHKLNQLLQQHAEFGREIAELREEISQLKAQEGLEHSTHDTAVESPISIEKPAVKITAEKPHPFAPRPTQKSEAKAKKAVHFEGTIEKFIGENLISKIGIGITIIGVGIGAKYAIDNDLISPLVRILLGYLVGLGLLFFAARLKKKYLDYSSVLFSGGMAILFLMTYFAHDFYGILSLPLSFVMMVITTAATVWGALHYNRQLIAHIGLVGAYAVPFLLGDEDGKATILFGYMALINTGILVTAFRRYWKPLYYVSFFITWFIFLFWYIVDYESPQDITTYFTFAGVFFGIFYLTFLAYKLIKKERFGWVDILLILANSFIFYAFGYALVSDMPQGEMYLGVFTVINAGIHAIAGGLVYRNGVSDPALLRFLLGLALVFAVIAVPVQLDGSWVTLFWAAGATVLTTVGIQRKIPFYFLLGFPLLILSFGSLAQDWMSMFNAYLPDRPETRIPLFISPYFLCSFLVIIAFGWISYLLWKKPDFSISKKQTNLNSVLKLCVPGLFFVIVFYTFQVEIATYWKQIFTDSITIPGQRGDRSIRLFGQVWELNYTLFFLTALSLVNLYLFKNRILAYVGLVLNGIGMLIFLSHGLYILSELRELYIDSAQLTVSSWAIYIRYISLLFFAGLVWASYRYTKASFVKWKLQVPFDLFLHLSIVWVLSSELIHWQDLAGAETAYKIGLSILWGAYALLLIMLGIWRRKAYLRFAAIALFAVTLIKLFFYDLTHLNTLSKTIVMVSLGAFLLMVSFLYNRYAGVIAGDD